MPLVDQFTVQLAGDTCTDGNAISASWRLRRMRLTGLAFIGCKVVVSHETDN